MSGEAHSRGVPDVARAYSCAADHYDRQALSFWDRFGTQTVARLGLAAGDRVLDLCCGAGASAIPAARAVGPDGHVRAVDISGPLLDLGRARAHELQLQNIDFTLADATRLALPDGSFDAVVCVFGVFFVPDMPGFVAEMWRMVRPGGTLAVTTWGVGLFEPANSLFWREVRLLRPDLDRGFNPWDDVTTVESLGSLLAGAGVVEPRVQYDGGVHALHRPEEFWDIVMGSGYRATVEALAPDQRTVLRSRLDSELHARGVTSLTTDVVFATARRSSPDGGVRGGHSAPPGRPRPGLDDAAHS